MSFYSTNPDDRVVSFEPDLPLIPERLLLAQSRGEVLFICGAGTSMPAGLPDFRSLVVDVYSQLDIVVHQIIAKIPRDVCNNAIVDRINLNDRQCAEVQRFILGDYDVVLGI